MSALGFDQLKIDPAQIAHRLMHLGFSAEAAAGKARLFEQCAAALPQFAPAADPPLSFFVPGRVEFLGKHTDYAGGRSILAAAQRGFCAIALPRADNLLHIVDAPARLSAEFPVAPGLAPEIGHWSNYPMTVARRIARNFPGPLRGADIVFASDLPPAAGMSSSTALIVLTFLALSAVNRLPGREEYRRDLATPELLASYLGCVENGQTFAGLPGDRGVGTFGGSEDHTAMLCSVPGQLGQFAYCPVRLERRLDWPAEFLLVIASSGVRAEKTGSALEQYNRVSRMMSSILDLWNRTTNRSDPTIASVLRTGPRAVDDIRKVLLHHSNGAFRPHDLLGRFEQFVSENQRIIPAAGDALLNRDFIALSSLVDRSHDLAYRFLNNQVPETQFLVEKARQLGAVAASAFGAGFGGSVWAMVRVDDADGFRSAWQHEYETLFPQHRSNAAFFTTRPGPSALTNLLA